MNRAIRDFDEMLNHKENGNGHNGDRTRTRTSIVSKYASTEEIPCVSFADMGEPEPQRYLVEGLIPEAYPSMWHGAGGNAKSMLALSMGLAVARGASQWLGLSVSKENVLYLDFELDQAEQNRRIKRLARGDGLEDAPRNMYYMSAVGHSPGKAFRAALDRCKEHDIKLLIVDSLSIALEGDPEASRDVIGFYQREIAPFRAAGVAVHVIDHQSKLQSGERYQEKSAFGSVFKTNLSRSVMQVEAVSHGDGRLVVRLRQTKHNFGPLSQPFGIELTFGSERVAVQTTEIDAEDLATENTLNSADRVLLALEAGPAGPDALAERTQLAKQTMKNALSKHRKDDRVEVTGEMEGRSEVVRLTDRGRAYLRTSIYRSTGTGTQQVVTPSEEDLDGQVADRDPTRPVCKKHRTRHCEPCYRELDELVYQGMLPKFAVKEVYLAGEPE